jgi:hypothetical protein
VGCGRCGVTPYVRHSTDCTCCDFGHLRFINVMDMALLKMADVSCDGMVGFGCTSRP